MQITHREARAIDIDRKIHLGAARQILDVAVAAMLARRHRACALGGRLGLGIARQLTHVGRARKRWIGKARHAVRIGFDQILFALIPEIEHLLVGQATDQAGMNQARIVHARNMARAREHAVKIPDRFLRRRKMVGQKSSPIVLAEKSVEAPLALFLGTDVEQIDHQQIARLRTLHAHGAGEVVHGAQIDVAYIVGAVVVLDEPARPVVGFQDEVIARVDPAGHRNIRVPAVVHLFVGGCGLRQVDFDEGFRHGDGSLVKSKTSSQ